MQPQGPPPRARWLWGARTLLAREYGEPPPGSVAVIIYRKDAAPRFTRPSDWEQVYSADWEHIRYAEAEGEITGRPDGVDTGACQRPVAAPAHWQFFSVITLKVVEACPPDRWVPGEQLASAAGVAHDRCLRTLLHDLVARGVLRSCPRGYKLNAP